MGIKRIELHDFKGVKDGTYDLPENPIIAGQNGSGKTTLADAYFWVFSDCDYSLAKNPNVVPLNTTEAEPTVTLVLDMDGKEVTVTKTQKNRSVKDGDTIKRSSTNKYFINNVPLTERDFKAKMLSLNFDINMVLPLSHPHTFLSQKAADMKKILFDMTDSHTDLEIAQKDEDTKELAEALENYTLEEIILTQKATKKKADEETKVIPEQIIGMERVKSTERIDIWLSKKGELEEKKSILNNRKSELEAKETTEEIRHQLFDVQKKLSDAENDLKNAEHDFRRATADTVLSLKRQIREQEDVLFNIDAKVKIAEDRLVDANRRKSEAAEEWKDLKNWYFEEFNVPEKLHEDNMVCPTCGQKLPENLRKRKIAEYEKDLAEKKRQYEVRKAMWEDKLKAEKERVTQKGQAACDELRQCETDMENYASMKERRLAQKKSLEKQLEVAMVDEERPFVPEEQMVQLVDSLRERESYLKQLMASSLDIANGDEMKSIKAELAECDEKLVEVEKTLALIRHNDEIDYQIRSLEKRKMEQEQKKAYAEQLLYQADLLSKRKNDLMVDEINSHFSMVKWQLFEYQKNGGYKEICVPTIDGYRFGESTNTGRELVAKLDICNSLQKFYGMKMPIFLDGAESLNDFNVPNLDTQLILLTVTNDKELVIRGC